MLTDIEIERQFKPKNILKVARTIGIKKSDCVLFGTDMCKIDCKKSSNKKGKLILVTAINPTTAGEGKTTVSIGLADALKMQKEKVCLALREPSLGPVFGMKGGACGGGYAQVMPMHKINLHFTGDFHAITSANNLLCAIVDNHIYQGNELKIDTNEIYVHRCMDMNDRALRNVEYFVDKNNILKRKESFSITSASELMAIFCLSSSFEDLKERISNILVAKTTDGKFIFAKDLKCVDSLAVLLFDAIKPNLVQSLAGTPAFVHGGPFANIAHGANSVIATNLALSVADYVVTEAGFGADLGAQKFFDVVSKSLESGISCVVLVATLKALKLHGGADKKHIEEENIDASLVGFGNLEKHLENIIEHYKLPVVVAINKFPSDTDKELEYIKNRVEKLNAKCEICSPYLEGGKGCLNLANAVKKECEKVSELTRTYEQSDSIKTKIEKIAKNIYGAKKVEFSELAKEKLQLIKKLKFENLDVIISKTQYSLSDNAKLLGRPTDFVLSVKDIEFRIGAGFVVAVCGDIFLMPGLPKVPNAEKLTITTNGEINGLS